MRSAALLFAAASLAVGLAAPSPPAPARTGFVQAVEFPYYLFPRELWERELVWLKGIGVDTVAFSIPWNWHQVGQGSYDFTGETSPRRDLAGMIRALRKAGMRAWIRPLPPVEGWLDRGLPAGTAQGGAAQRAWLRELYRLLSTQTTLHGGPIAYVEGQGSGLDAPAPPAPVVTVPVSRPDALLRARERLLDTSGARGSVVWTGLEDALYPAGWAAFSTPPFQAGAVGLSGGERTSLGALRRNSALVRGWCGLLPGFRAAAVPKPANGKLPEGVRLTQATSPAGSVVAIANAGRQPFQSDISVFDPTTGRSLVIPGVSVPAGESLWLPVRVSIGPGGLCSACTNFSSDEHIIYATAELTGIEYENGILAMEFTAPEPGEAILQLARKPVGPFLAGGALSEFDWDEKTLRARLRIPAGSGSAKRVRIGLAIEEPEDSGFLNDARRLIIGRSNTLSATYSSNEIAARSRLRAPQGFAVGQSEKSPNEIDYFVTVPSGALHGDWADLTLEADGLPLGRAHVQLLRPVSLRLSQPVRLHFGDIAELTPEPQIIPVDARGGTNVELVIRNNSLEIQAYRLEAEGDGLDIYPPRTEIAVGAMDERAVALRIFGKEGAEGFLDFRLRLSGPAEAATDARVLLVPRNRTVAWTADLDGDGAPEWVLESHRARAVFSARTGRWMEFTWKDENLNFLPEQGVPAPSAHVEVRSAGDALEFTGDSWKRTVRLVDASLEFEGNASAPQIAPEKRGDVTMTVARESDRRVVFTLKR